MEYNYGKYIYRSEDIRIDEESFIYLCNKSRGEIVEKNVENFLLFFLEL